jgi:hypothetical protein
MATKFFKRAEAQNLLPVIAPELERACGQKRRLATLETDLSRASAEIMVLGGSIPPRTELARKKTERDRLAQELTETLAKITRTGCLVKDLEMGLVDFPALHEGEEVYLCWKLGEERVEYWHRIQEGFAGRQLLDETFPDEPENPRVH